MRELKRVSLPPILIAIFLFVAASNAKAAISLDDMVRQICNNPEAFSSVQALAQQQSLAPALVNILKDVNQSKCWSNASQVLSMMGPAARETLPEILQLVKGTSSSLSGPLRELQQAFAISALPSLSGYQAQQSIRTLMGMMSSNQISPSLRDLSASALINKFSAIDSYDMLLKLAKESEQYARGQIDQAQIQRIVSQLRAQTQQEAIKWIRAFDRELKKLNSMR